MHFYSTIEQAFRQFLKERGENAYKHLKVFFEEQKDIFYAANIKELQAQGLTNEQATIKTRQAWVSTMGRSLEVVIEILLTDFCYKHNLKITNDKALRSKNLTAELDGVKRAIVVHFDEYSVLPDGDIIIYRVTKHSTEVLAILSVKNSFRERYTETPYWKLKLLQSEITQHIQVFMVTPDNDDEISFTTNPKKSRIVMEYELDGIYLAKEQFDSSNKVKGIEQLVNDLEKLL